MGKIITPKTYVQNIDNPLIFLAGPITDAPRWRSEAIDILLTENSDIDIATPEIGGIEPKFFDNKAYGPQNHFERIRAWEWHYLRIAAKTGAVLFWLPERIQRSEKDYGAMTRAELGWTMGKYESDKAVRFCVGTDNKFSEIHTLLYDLQVECAPDKKTFSTLEETCAEAVRLASQR